MENNKRKSVIVEFNGLPGSGKTTITRYLKEELERDGHKVYLNYSRNRWDNNFYSMLFYPTYWSITQKMYDYSKTLSTGRNLKRALQLSHFVRMYRTFIKDEECGILLLDQAIVQLFISLAHNDTLLNSPMLKSLLRELRLEAIPFALVNCEVKKEISNKRIEMRPSNGCRVEGTSKLERCKILDVQKDNFEFMRRALMETYPIIKQINVDTSLPLEQTVEKIRRGLTIL